MKIVVHDRLRRPQTLDVTRVVVYDAMDNPLGYALEYAPGVILADVVRKGHEAEFMHMLREMGINKVVHVEDVPTQPLNAVRFKG